MAGASVIHIEAVVSPGEREAVARAAALLADALRQAGGGEVAVECTFAETVEALAPAAGPSILVTSLAAEVERTDEPWPEVEARLRAGYEALCEDPRRMVFVCTVFRHVSRELPRDRAMDRRVRIRRLNLLALELSRELGVMVADIDRDLADIGALAFETDHRLLGPYAAGAAGKSIAMAVAHVGLDEFASFAVQEAAREGLRAVRPAQAGVVAPPPLKLGGIVGSVRSRQRVQTVEYAEEPVDDAVAASHVKRLLSGKLGLMDAAAIIGQAVARRGVRGSAARLVMGLRKAADDARAVRR